jgi:hypothetical protein
MCWTCVVCVWLCPAHILFTLLVLFMWLCPAHILFTLFVLLVCGGVQHISYLRYLCCLSPHTNNTNNVNTIKKNTTQKSQYVLEYSLPVDE